ncbi:hypothetical protein GCM10027176_22500 [Actinoallomurus bryophytorum]
MPIDTPSAAVFEEGVAVVTYAARTLPADTRDALVSAISAAMGEPSDLAFTVSSPTRRPVPRRTGLRSLRMADPPDVRYVT